MVKSQLSFRLRQNAAQNQNAIRKDVPKKSAKNTQSAPKQIEKPKPPQKANNSGAGGGLFFLAGETAFKTILSARFCSAIWSQISDCDETYNYWEPMHYLVYTKGLQTWEYSPEYALRSYFYLMLHAAPAWIYNKLLQPNPLLMFYFIRCILVVVCAFCELYFYKAICKEFGVHIGRICLAFQVFSAGMFVASPAFLPSTFGMYCATMAYGAWLQQKYPLAIFQTALGSLLGWPFAALLGLPIAYDMLVRRKLYADFLVWTGMSAVFTLGPMIIFDSILYGRLVVAPLNLVKYNVLSGAGPDLYGTEPFSYYLVNGLLNFNFVWVFSLLCPLFLVLNHFFVPSKHKSTLNLPHWLSLSPLYLWLAVFMFQKHKEERFLFPIYPLICLTGAITLDVMQKLCFRVWNLIKKSPPGTHYLDKTTFVMVGWLIVTSLLGVSRICALYRNYHAPMNLMMELNRYPLENPLPDNAEINVCLGKDWHRYPSSFFLPNTRWNVRFIKSEFDGMLPSPYSHLRNATAIVPDHFNDQNREVPSQYFNINKCHFFFDFDVEKETELEPSYVNDKDKWKIFKTYKFLNSEKSTNKFARAFYVPFLTEKYNAYGDFNLLQSTKVKIK